MDKETAKSLLKNNLKGPKTKPSSLLVVAEATKLLISDSEYGSTVKLAKAFGVSRQTIESFYKINDQPDEIKKLIRNAKIGIDASTKLLGITAHQRRISIAEAVAGLSAYDTREIINYCKRQPNLSVEECKEFITNRKTTKERNKSVSISLKQADHQKFLEASKKAGLSPKEAGKQAISEWTKKHAEEKLLKP